MIPIRQFFILLSFAGLVLAWAAAPAGAAEPDWDSVDARTVVFFYPGVTSWEFLTSEDHRLGGRDIRRRRKDCRHCHLSKDGELDLKAEEIVSGGMRMKRSQKPFEPEPEMGKPGVMRAEFQAAYDSDTLYIRVRWPSRGLGWKAAEGAETPSDRVSVQINRGSSAFAKYGCFVTCHNAAASMPGSPSPEEVRAEPYYSELGRDHVHLYAFYARESWKKPAPASELTKLRRSGGLIDLLSLEIKSGSAHAEDGWVLDDRRWEDDGGLTGDVAYSGGSYTAVFRRSLGTKGPGDVDLGAGEAVSVNVSIHDGGVTQRKHYVSFPFTLGIGAGAEYEAEKAE